MDIVPGLLAEVAREKILPRFGALVPDDIDQKTGPADLVTIADREAEDWLTERLPHLLPGSTVVGEEAVSADPEVLSRLHGDEWVWLIDPVDGTQNFVDGSPRFAVMVALVRGQETMAGWIYPPVEGDCAIVQRGQGAWLHGERLAGRKAVAPSAAVADFSRQYFDQPVSASLSEVERRVAQLDRGSCSAFAYLQTAAGTLDMVVQYKLSPWDHAAGVLMVEEAGGRTGFLADGAPYVPLPQDPEPMLTVGDASAWDDYAAMIRELSR